MEGNFDPNIKTGFRSAFHSWCHQAVIEGYREMAKDTNAGFSEWEEEDLSARLAKESQDLRWVKQKNIKIIPEYRLYDDKVYSGQKKAKSAGRIDFLFSSWNNDEDHDYFAEAKNLYDTDRRNAGDASKSKRYYINGGIKRFVSSAYPYGFLLGYVLRGEIDEMVSSLNKMIEKIGPSPFTGQIAAKTTLHLHPYCYMSSNTAESGTLELRHIFLKF